MRTMPAEVTPVNLPERVPWPGLFGLGLYLGVRRRVARLPEPQLVGCAVAPIWGGAPTFSEGGFGRPCMP